ncbi:MAG: AgmX/PglI C-terminal domain-containing protein [Chitinivibrionales bacterium]|nr:AgmX/PglI C-terminal domain-containing protein [Chitinivibrionales bacterium]
MKYKVLIQKCSEPERAAKIAEEVAKLSGSSVAVVIAAIVQKTVCIKKEAEESEAQRLKQQFEAVGAEVILEELDIPEEKPVAAPAPPAAPVAAAATTASAQPPPQPAAPQQPAAASPKSYDDDEYDEDEEPGRIRSPEEYSEILKTRNDIFIVDRSKKIHVIQAICFVCALVAGFVLNTYEYADVATDFFEKIPEERVAKLVKDLPETLQKKKEDEKKEDIKTDKKKLKPKKKKGAGGRTGGGGDPRARVTRKGVLGIISGQIKGKTVASADVFGKGGFASGIDAILQGVGGLKAGGSGGVGRKGAAGIGYGAGYGSGFGGGGGGIDDLIGGLMGGDDGSALGLKKRGSLKISAPKFVKGGALTGGRSMASIRRVVMQNLAALRYAYNKRLREKPGLKGKITVKWAIDEFGKVIFAQVVSSTIKDSQLEATVVSKIKRWAFGKIDKPGDVTEVVYPFVFSQ